MGTFTTSDQLLRVATERIDRLQHETQQRRLADTLASEADMPGTTAAPSRRLAIPTPHGWSRRALSLVGR